MSDAYPFKLSDTIHIAGDRYFHVYVIETDDGCILFETGVCATAKKVIGQIASLGIDPDRVKYIVVSHEHADHATGLAYLTKAYRHAVVVSSPPTKERLSKARVVESFFEEDVHFAGRYRDFGEEPYEALRYDAGVTLTVGNGDTICNKDIKVIATPGHTPGSLSLLVRREGVLLVSDALGFCYADGSIFPLPFYDLRQYLQSIRLIESLSPERIGLGHVAYFKHNEVGRLLERVTEQTQDTLDYITQRLKDGSTEEEIRAGLMKPVYRDEMTIYKREVIELSLDSVIKQVKKYG